MHEFYKQGFFATEKIKEEAAEILVAVTVRIHSVKEVLCDVAILLLMRM